jgi:hypothetical protein
VLRRPAGRRPGAGRAEGRGLSGAAATDVEAGEPLALAHRDALEPLLAARWSRDDPPEATLSDPWFANLFLFRAAHGWRFVRGEWPCVAGRGYDGARLVIPLFDLEAAPDDALRARLHGADAFAPLSERQAARLDPARFALASARDDADYLYPAENFLHYRGTALNKKRNLVKQLLAAHAVHTLPYDASLAGEAGAVLDGWMAAKGKPAGEADDVPCREALRLAGALGLHGFLHRVDGRAAGFVLAHAIAPGVHVMRFAKGLDAHKGLYQHMFQHYCRATPDVRWLNFEQDLGLANFRRTKLSYRPSALLAKVRVTLK